MLHNSCTDPYLFSVPQLPNYEVLLVELVTNESRNSYRLTHKNPNAANRNGLELGLEPPLWCAKYQLQF